MKRTKILCTIGPASKSKSVLKRMISAGMNGIRINTAHADFPRYEEIVKNVREISDLPIMLDIKGPELRIKTEGKLQLTRGQVLEVGVKKSDKTHFTRDVYDQVEEGDLILLDNGLIRTHVSSKKKGKIILKIQNGGNIEGNKSVNIPNKRMSFPLLSEKDLKAIEFGKEKDVEYISLSFTRDAHDVKTLQKHIKGSGIGIISKIENRQGVLNADEIIKESDGIMVARGDLGSELPPEKIPMIQKDLVIRANKAGKISIVATEMLQSMVENIRPTRAETSDVANAILDGADVIMLSAESAIGKHPVESVRILSSIAAEIESQPTCKTIEVESTEAIPTSIARAVSTIMAGAHVDKIVVATRTGYTAMLISNFRVCSEILALTESEKVKRRLHLAYGVKPIWHPPFPGRNMILRAADYCLKNKLVKTTDTVLFTAGKYINKPSTNTIEIHRINELEKYMKEKRVKLD